ncbi:MAG: THUMP domain-containing protein [Gammaproteobacteria bacterium]|jgi:tRNA(Ser,Leu) C12 N-acetylase TAN1
MNDWNVVVTIQQGKFPEAIQFLETIGRVSKTNYYNVLVMKVNDVEQFLVDLDKEIKAVPALVSIISRVLPATVNFDFQMPAEFEAQITQAVEAWVPQLAGSSFHVRMHRRGFRGRLSSQNEEQLFDHFIKEKLVEHGAVGTIDFDNPDFIIDIETVGQRAGVTLWTREQRLRYSFLKLN